MLRKNQLLVNILRGFGMGPKSLMTKSPKFLLKQTLAILPSQAAMQRML